VIDLLAVGQIAIAVLADLGVVVLVGSIVDQPLALPTSIGDLFGDFARSTILIVLPTTFVMGLTFPAASALIAGRDDEVGSRAGLLLASNTLGAIIATFAIPFIVIPLVGSPVALGLVAIVNAVTGVAIALGGRIERPVPRVVRHGRCRRGARPRRSTPAACSSTESIAGSKASGVSTSRPRTIASVQAGQLRLTAMGHRVSMTLLTVDASSCRSSLIFRPASTTELTIAFGMGSATGGLIANRGRGVDLVPRSRTCSATSMPTPPSSRRSEQAPDHQRRPQSSAYRPDYDIVVVDPPPVQGAGVSVVSSREFTKTRGAPESAAS
jgi:hypothetical protein